jgi:hypothetical protein
VIAAARWISFVCPTAWLRGLLIVALTLAGAIHLLLTHDHFAESPLLGVGFFGSAFAELGLALAVLVKPRRLVYFAVIGVTSALIGLYAYNVMIGLPFSGARFDSNLLELTGHTEDPHHSTSTDHDSGHEAAAHSAGDHHSGGLVLGEGEPIDTLGATTKLSELASVGLAIALVLRSRGTRPYPEPRVGGRNGSHPIPGGRS